jgi:hypothetical protein
LRGFLLASNKLILFAFDQEIVDVKQARIHLHFLEELIALTGYVPSSHIIHFSLSLDAVLLIEFCVCIKRNQFNQIIRSL